MNAGRVFVCLTCNRYASPEAGQATPGQRLAAALKQHAARSGSAVAIRTVECLNVARTPAPRRCAALAK
jgi:predicted metal-binding protein